MMTPSPALLLTLLAVAVAAFIFEWAAPDVVALTLLAVLILGGYLTAREGFSGFSSGAAVLLVSALIVSEALARTGLSRWLARLLARTSGGSRWLRARVMIGGALLSLGMNNVAVTALLLPATTEAARRRSVPPGKILLPLALAVQLGGMATILTTANIVSGEMLRREGRAPLTLAEFFAAGAPATIAGLLFLFFASDRILRSVEGAPDLRSGPAGRSLVDIYELGRRLESVRILASSPLVGRTLGKSGLSTSMSAVVIAIVHADGAHRRAPEPQQVLRSGDILILDGVPPDPTILAEAGLELIRIKRPTRFLASPRVGLAEGVVAPRSRLAGRTLKELNFRETSGGLSVISIWREGEFLEGDLSDVKLKFGDGLLLQGPHGALRNLRATGDVLLLESAVEPEIPQWQRRSVGTVLAASVVVSLILPDHVPLVFFCAACAILLSRAVPANEAYRSLDWRSVVLVGAMLPIGIALTRSGAAQIVADGLVHGLHLHGAVPLFLAFVLLTAVVTQFLPGGAAAPLLIAPLAIAAASSVGANPRSFAMGVALATSVSFVTPFAHPANLIVAGPGGYRMRDFLRLGLPLAVLCLAVITISVAVAIPFHG